MMTGRSQLVFILFLHLLFILTYSSAQTTKEYFGSSVRILIFDSKKEFISAGRGYVVDNNKIITSLHLLKGGSQGIVMPISSHDEIKIEGINNFDSFYDIACVTIEDPIDFTLGFREEDIRVNEKVFISQGVNGELIPSRISKKISTDSVNYFILDSYIQAGTCGGPVLDSHGLILGTCRTIVTESNPETILIPIQVYKNILKSNKSTTPLSNFEYPNHPSIWRNLGELAIEGIEIIDLKIEPVSEGKSNKIAFNYNVKNKLAVPVSNILIGIFLRNENNETYESFFYKIKKKIPARKKINLTQEFEFENRDEILEQYNNANNHKIAIAMFSISE